MHAMLKNLNYLNQGEKDFLFLEYIGYCEKGNYSALKELFVNQGKSKKRLSYSSLIQGFFVAVKKSDHILFEYLLTNIPLDHDAVETLMKYIAHYSDSTFIRDLIKYQKRKVENLLEESEVLVVAAENKNLEMVNYLLTTNEIKNPDIHANYDKALRKACNLENIEIIKYLLTSPKIKEHANVHVKNDECLIWSFKAEKFKTVDYLLKEYKIDINTNIELYMIEDKKFNEYIHTQSPQTDE